MFVLSYLEYRRDTAKTKHNSKNSQLKTEDITNTSAIYLRPKLITFHRAKAVKYQKIVMIRHSVFDRTSAHRYN